MRRRFWVETGTALLSAVLAVLTLFRQDWIEITGWDPDRHSGGLEWLVAGGLAVLALGSGLLARSEWQHRPAMA